MKGQDDIASRAQGHERWSGWWEWSGNSARQHWRCPFCGETGTQIHTGPNGLATFRCSATPEGDAYLWDYAWTRPEGGLREERVLRSARKFHGRIAGYPYERRNGVTVAYPMGLPNWVTGQSGWYSPTGEVPPSGPVAEGPYATVTVRLDAAPDAVSTPIEPTTGADGFALGRREFALAAVRAERERQEVLRRTGRFRATCATTGAEGMNNEQCYRVLGEEVGEVARVLNEWDENPVARAALREELVQVAAVAVAWIERLDEEAGR